jgi:hypothetical protein
MSNLTDQGYTACHCGKFVHIYRAAVLQLLPKDYSGEMCAECGVWMCAIDKVESTDCNRGPPPTASLPTER